MSSNAMWRKPTEITCFGQYLLFRVDESLKNIPLDSMVKYVDGRTVDIVQGVDGFFMVSGPMNEIRTIQEVSTLDNEVRFFGPMSSGFQETLSELLCGLWGPMG